MRRNRVNTFKGDFIFSLLLALYLSLLPIEAVLSLGAIGSFHKVIGIVLIFITLLRNRFRFKITNAWMILFSLISVVSAIWSFSQETTIAYSLTIISIVFYTIVMEQHRYTEQEYNLVYRAIIVVGLLLSLNIIFGTTVTVIEVGRTTISLFGSRVDHNNMALGLAFSDILLLLELTNMKYQLFKRILILFGCLLITYAILLTGSRGGLLCFVVAAAFYLFHLLKSFNILYRVFLVLFTALSVVFVDQLLIMLPSDIANRFTITDVISNGGSGRLSIWTNAFDYYRNTDFFRKLFGIGYGAFPFMHYTYYNFYVAAHNDYIQILIELGSVGFMCIVGVLGKEIRKSIKSNSVISAAVLLLVIVACLTMETIFKKVTWSAILIAYIARSIDHNNCTKSEPDNKL